MDTDNREMAWPFNGYAPGTYAISCVGCGKVKELCDKRAIRCLECAVSAAKASQLLGVVGEREQLILAAQDWLLESPETSQAIPSRKARLMLLHPMRDSIEQSFRLRRKPALNNTGGQSDG